MTSPPKLDADDVLCNMVFFIAGLVIGGVLGILFGIWMTT